MASLCDLGRIEVLLCVITVNSFVVIFDTVIMSRSSSCAAHSPFLSQGSISAMTPETLTAPRYYSLMGVESVLDTAVRPNISPGPL